MLASLAYAIALCTAAQIEVVVAPDQSFHRVYLDDPLVLEFVSPVDADLRVEVGMQVAGQPPRSYTIGSLRLPAGTPVWKTVGDRPRARGPHDLSIRILTDGNRQEVQSRYFRVGRPGRLARVPLLVTASDAFRPELYRALRALPVSEVRVDATAADWTDTAGWLVSLGYRIVVRVPPEADVAEVALDAEPIVSAITRWELSYDEDTEHMAETASVLRGLTPEAAILISADTMDEASAALKADAFNRVDGFVLRGDDVSFADLERQRGVAEAMGFEGLRFELESDSEMDGVSHLVIRLASGLRVEIVDPAKLFAEDALQDGFCERSAFAELLARTRYVGPLRLEGEGEGHLFLSRDAQADWVVPLWSTGEEAAVEIEVGEALNVAVLDRFGNPIESTEVVDGRLKIVLEMSPVYLRGSGGNVVADAVRDGVREEAARLAKDSGEELDGLNSVLGRLESGDGGPAHRFEFLRIVQLLEVIERRWHLGELGSETAVPLSARIARIAMGLSALQEELGDPILEPLAATLAKCEEFKQRFQDASAEEQATPRRGRWLAAEVDRLSAFARELEVAGRHNEARAVATVAEWRARGLGARLSLSESEETP